MIPPNMILRRTSDFVRKRERRESVKFVKERGQGRKFVYFSFENALRKTKSSGMCMDFYIKFINVKTR